MRSSGVQKEKNVENRKETKHSLEGGNSPFLRLFSSLISFLQDDSLGGEGKFNFGCLEFFDNVEVDFLLDVYEIGCFWRVDIKDNFENEGRVTKFFEINAIWFGFVFGDDGFDYFGDFDKFGVRSVISDADLEERSPFLASVEILDAGAGEISV